MKKYKYSRKEIVESLIDWKKSIGNVPAEIVFKQLAKDILSTLPQEEDKEHKPEVDNNGGIYCPKCEEENKEPLVIKDGIGSGGNFKPEEKKECKHNLIGNPTSDSRRECSKCHMLISVSPSLPEFEEIEEINEIPYKLFSTNSNEESIKALSEVIADFGDKINEISQKTNQLIHNDKKTREALNKLIIK